MVVHLSKLIKVTLLVDALIQDFLRGADTPIRCHACFGHATWPKKKQNKKVESESRFPMSNDDEVQEMPDNSGGNQTCDEPVEKDPAVIKP